MQLPDPQYLSYSKPFGRVQLSIHGTEVPVDIIEGGLTGHGFYLALWAKSSAYEGEMLGFSGFKHCGTFAAEPSVMLLRQQTTDERFYQQGIGKTLLNHSRMLARERQKTLVLEPEAPMRRDMPLTTEQLRDMYLRNGFREFTDDEVASWTERFLDHQLRERLWFEGYDPKTLEPTGHPRYSASQEDLAQFDHVPLEEKARIIGRLWATRPNWATIESSRRGYEETVRKYLVARES